MQSNATVASSIANTHAVAFSTADPASSSGAAAASTAIMNDKGFAAAAGASSHHSLVSPISPMSELTTTSADVMSPIARMKEQVRRGPQSGGTSTAALAHAPMGLSSFLSEERGAEDGHTSYKRVRDDTTTGAEVHNSQPRHGNEEDESSPGTSTPRLTSAAGSRTAITLLAVHSPPKNLFGSPPPLTAVGGTTGSVALPPQETVEASEGPLPGLSSPKDTPQALDRLQEYMAAAKKDDDDEEQKGGVPDAVARSSTAPTAAAAARAPSHAVGRGPSPETTSPSPPTAPPTTHPAQTYAATTASAAAKVATRQPCSRSPAAGKEEASAAAPAPVTTTSSERIRKVTVPSAAANRLYERLSRHSSRNPNFLTPPPPAPLSREGTSTMEALHTTHVPAHPFSATQRKRRSDGTGPLATAGLEFTKPLLSRGGGRGGRRRSSSCDVSPDRPQEKKSDAKMEGGQRSRKRPADTVPTASPGLPSYAQPTTSSAGKKAASPGTAPLTATMASSCGTGSQPNSSPRTRKDSKPSTTTAGSVPTNQESKSVVGAAGSQGHGAPVKDEVEGRSSATAVSAATSGAGGGGPAPALRDASPPLQSLSPSQSHTSKGREAPSSTTAATAAVVSSNEASTGKRPGSKSPSPTPLSIEMLATASQTAVDHSATSATAMNGDGKGGDRGRGEGGPANVSSASLAGLWAFTFGTTRGGTTPLRSTTSSTGIGTARVSVAAGPLDIPSDAKADSRTRRRQHRHSKHPSPRLDSGFDIVVEDDDDDDELQMKPPGWREGSNSVFSESLRDAYASLRRRASSIRVPVELVPRLDFSRLAAVVDSEAEDYDSDDREEYLFYKENISEDEGDSEPWRQRHGCSQRGHRESGFGFAIYGESSTSASGAADPFAEPTSWVTSVYSCSCSASFTSYTASSSSASDGDGDSTAGGEEGGASPIAVDKVASTADRAASASQPGIPQQSCTSIDTNGAGGSCLPPTDADGNAVASPLAPPPPLPRVPLLNIVRAKQKVFLGRIFPDDWRREQGVAKSAKSKTTSGGASSRKPKKNKKTNKEGDPGRTKKTARQHGSPASASMTSRQSKTSRRSSHATAASSATTGRRPSTSRTSYASRSSTTYSNSRSGANANTARKPASKSGKRRPTRDYLVAATVDGCVESPLYAAGQQRRLRRRSDTLPLAVSAEALATLRRRGNGKHAHRRHHHHYRRVCRERRRQGRREDHWRYYVHPLLRREMFFTNPIARVIAGLVRQECAALMRPLGWRLGLLGSIAWRNGLPYATVVWQRMRHTVARTPTQHATAPAGTSAHYQATHPTQPPASSSSAAAAAEAAPRQSSTNTTTSSRSNTVFHTRPESSQSSVKAAAATATAAGNSSSVTSNNAGGASAMKDAALASPKECAETREFKHTATTSSGPQSTSSAAAAAAAAAVNVPPPTQTAATSEFWQRFRPRWGLEPAY